MPRVSVIMGIYNEKNRENVIKAIDSVLTQTYKDFEFIICDDGSTEDFYKWLSDYCKKDSRIKIIRNRGNQGLSVALNNCLKEAAGEYIVRMDADDISVRERLEKQVKFMDENARYVMAGSNVELIDDAGKWGERKLVEKPEEKDFLFNSPFVHPSIIIRSEVIKELGGYSTEKYALRNEDYDLFMRMYAAGFKAYNIQQILLKYRESRDSYSKRKYIYRINESKVRYKGYKSMGILKGNLRYVIKPLLVGLIPRNIMMRIKARRYTK